MQIFRSLLLLITTALFSAGCNSPAPVIEDQEAYRLELEEWQKARLERLKGKSGWLNLSGLFWLKEGVNTFGSDPLNDIVFPEKAVAFCGKLVLKNGSVNLEVEEGADISSNGVPVTSLKLNNDHEKPTSYMEQGELAWFIVKRDDKYGIRLRDYKHPRINELDRIPTWPINTDYVVEASLLPFAEAKEFTVATPVEGFTETYKCPGELHFNIHKKDLVLYPFSSGKGYFLVIADETTGLESYGAGRFMYTEPDSTGRIILDFNKASNPPCAFSPFATCPMPPRENFLPIAIEAGEKSVHLH